MTGEPTLLTLSSPPRRGYGSAAVTSANARLALFASGDFACNLYWQSLTFFLLFFYTEVARLPPATAGLVLLIGSVWDGIAALAAGMWTQRRTNYRRCMIVGAAPLGLAFVALYTVPPIGGVALAVVVTVAHLTFRTLYAIVNVPFAALTATISRDSAARSRIAAFRMLYGTAAAIVVALVTRTASLTAHGTVTGARGYAMTAIGFGLIGTLILVAAARTTRDLPTRTDARAGAPAAAIARLLGNRAFATLNLAAALTVVAAGVLNGSVLFYFTYVEHDAAAGPAAMAWMGIAGALAIPGWTALRGRVGTRGLWLIDAAFALAVVALFAWAGRGILATQAFLFAMQVAMIGFFYAFWAMLPDTVEWGEHRHGLRLEGITFGMAAMGQKLAAGAASGLLGLLLGAIGYSGGHATGDPEGIADGLRLILLAVPALAIALSMAVMALNPLRRDTHAAIVAAIDARGGG